MSQNFWNSRYLEQGFAYGINPNDFLVEMARHIEPYSDILCLAEGEGRNAVFLAGLGHRVTAVDFSESGIKKTQRLARKKAVAVQTQLADLTQFDLGIEKWNAIVSIWCHLPSVARADLHHRCFRALEPGGVFILEAYTPSQLNRDTGGPKEADLLMSLDQLKRELGGFDLMHGIETTRPIHEGKYHKGLSDVVQVVARKP